MTQLNLSGRQPNNNQQKPVKEEEEGSIKNQTVGAMGALAMFAAVIVIGSCAGSKPVAVKQPIQPTTPVSAPAVATPAPVPAPVMTKAKAIAKKRRAATLSYVNHDYGVSLSFARNYLLKAGKDVPVASAATEPIPMNFVHAGGVKLAAVQMPGDSYPGTDFKSAALSVSVNPGMTSEACAQFGSPESTAGIDGSSQAEPAQSNIAQVKVGAIQFDEVENLGGSMMKHADAKYYHVFSNGACYEFALGIATDGDANLDEVTPVDRGQVFAKLEKILATVNLQPGTGSETQKSAAAVAISTSPEPSHAAQPATEEKVTAPNF